MISAVREGKLTLPIKAELGFEPRLGDKRFYVLSCCAVGITSE